MRSSRDFRISHPNLALLTFVVSVSNLGSLVKLVGRSFFPSSGALSHFKIVASSVVPRDLRHMPSVIP